MRVREFHISMRELHALLTRGSGLPDVVQIAIADIPEGCKVHHLGVQPSGESLSASE